MTEERWKPRVTVAAVIEKQNRFLLVKEKIQQNICFNQPAGHLENGESLIDAIKREVLEETGWPFQPSALVGIYRWVEPKSKETFLRFTFCGEIDDSQAQQKLDSPIIEACWFTQEEIEQCQTQHRSPQVLRSMNNYLKGNRFPLSTLIDIGQ